MFSIQPSKSLLCSPTFGEGLQTRLQLVLTYARHERAMGRAWNNVRGQEHQATAYYKAARAFLYEARAIKALLSKLAPS